ncbi:MAG: hypothetical protein AB7G75_22405 [Candidatus Binatia bacterium]
MSGLDLYPIAAASLDMTAELAPLLYGLCFLVVLSAAGIAFSALRPWLQHERRLATASATSGLSTASVTATAVRG